MFTVFDDGLSAPRHPASSRLNDNSMQLIGLLEFFHLMSSPTRYERTGAVLFGNELQALGIRSSTTTSSVAATTRPRRF